MTPEQIRYARDLLTRPEKTVASIATLLGVSRNTIYKYPPELKTGPRRTHRRTRAESHQRGRRPARRSFKISGPTWRGAEPLLFERRVHPDTIGGFAVIS